MQITPKAAAHLRRLRRERGVGAKAAVRFERRQDQRLKMTFVEAPQSGDIVLESRDPQLFVARDAVEPHDHSVIDVLTREGRTRLVLHRRRVEARAGEPSTT